MSAKNRKQAAKAFDQYPTDPRLARAGFEKLCQRYGSRLTEMTTFLEPGAGRGPFCQAARLYLPNVCRVVGVEMHTPPRDRFKYELVTQDFLAWQPKFRPNLIATNPPFTPAAAFIQHSQALLAPGGLMLYLMRVGILGSKKRRELWQQVNLLETWIIRPRPSFQYEGGSDASEYAFFVMDGRQPKAGCSRSVRLDWVDWDGDADEDFEDSP